ncbi:hypothetical protein [uncultured Nostoc sp.]|uniref:hypothetical protein n=1 Tax=uncultured Nostoc sp. TaxID=340711 RepID=UPI0035CA227A
MISYISPTPCFSTESRRPLLDGQWVRYYHRLNTEDVEFVQKILKYRQREEKELKRQESLEPDAAYKARMQAQYGVEQREKLV